MAAYYSGVGLNTCPRHPSFAQRRLGGEVADIVEGASFGLVGLFEPFKNEISGIFEERHDGRGVAAQKAWLGGLEAFPVDAQITQRAGLIVDAHQDRPHGLELLSFLGQARGHVAAQGDHAAGFLTVVLVDHALDAPRHGNRGGGAGRGMEYGNHRQGGKGETRGNRHLGSLNSDPEELIDE